MAEGVVSFFARPLKGGEILCERVAEGAAASAGMTGHDNLTSHHVSRITKLKRGDDDEEEHTIRTEADIDNGSCRVHINNLKCYVCMHVCMHLYIGDHNYMNGYMLLVVLGHCMYILYVCICVCMYVCMYVY